MSHDRQTYRTEIHSLHNREDSGHEDCPACTGSKDLVALADLWVKEDQKERPVLMDRLVRLENEDQWVIPVKWGHQVTMERMDKLDHKEDPVRRETPAHPVLQVNKAYRLVLTSSITTMKHADLIVLQKRNL